MEGDSVACPREYLPTFIILPGILRQGTQIVPNHCLLDVTILAGGVRECIMQYEPLDDLLVSPVDRGAQRGRTGTVWFADIVAGAGVVKQPLDDLQMTP